MADSASFILYSFWRSTAAYRVRVVVRLKGLAVDERFVDLDAGEQHADAFRRINPMGAVPALIESDTDGEQPPLTESLAIIGYFDQIQPEPPLWPSDARGRARVQSIAETTAADIHPLIVPRIRRYLADAADFGDDEWRAWQIHWYQTGLQGLEKRLAEDPATGAYCHGDTVTVADIFVTAIVAIMRVFDIRVPDIPTIDGIVARCERLPAFAESDPMRQPGAPSGD